MPNSIRHQDHFKSRSRPEEIHIFVQATVLKTVTEHPQGMTTAEITAELGPQGIGRESIANALGALVQAEKVSSRREEDKYFPAAAEVPTAPDQPSS